MHTYTVKLYLADKQVPVAMFKEKNTFFWDLSKVLHEKLDPTDFTTLVFCDEIAIEVNTKVPGFEGTRFMVPHDGYEIELRVGKYVYNF